MRNLHLILLQEYGIEAWHLFREWERLRLRASDYKNHRIFTLRCLHKDLVPVSIKLKSTLNTSKARQIIRKAEKDLLQARVKAINNILDQVAKQTEDCRTQLASIISAERLRECQGLIDKVSEFRFTKVKQRQLNKFNNLINKKQRNITRANATIQSNNLVSQTIRQASASPPLGEDNNTLPTNSQAGANTNLPPAIAHLPPRGGSNSLPATAHLPSEGSSFSQAATAHLPSEGSSFSQATALLPTREGSNALPAAAHLPSEGSSFSQVATAHLPSEGSSFSQATALLPTGQGSNALPAAAHLPSEGNSSSQATALLPSGEGSSNPQAGQSNNPTRSVRQGCRHSPRHRATQSSQENSTISQEDTSTTAPLVAPQGSSNEEPNPKWVINLSNKPLTPAPRSVLAKGPNFAVTPRQPPNLEYITAIEAACTKLSQQDAGELRADVNRVLRSSYAPKPNLTKAQNLALRELKRDRDRIVLTADKGVAMVIIDRQDYIKQG